MGIKIKNKCTSRNDSYTRFYYTFGLFLSTEAIFSLYQDRHTHYGQLSFLM